MIFVKVGRKPTNKPTNRTDAVARRQYHLEFASDRENGIALPTRPLSCKCTHGVPSPEHKEYPKPSACAPPKPRFRYPELRRVFR